MPACVLCGHPDERGPLCLACTVQALFRGYRMPFAVSPAPDLTAMRRSAARAAEEQGRPQLLLTRGPTRLDGSHDKVPYFLAEADASVEERRLAVETVRPPEGGAHA